MSQEKSDVFKMDIGDLKKGENCHIRISYVQELKMDDHKIRFRLPQSIAPRYVLRIDVDVCPYFISCVIQIQSKR